MQTEEHRRRHWRANRLVIAVLLLVLCVVTFGISFFARELNFRLFGWPFSFWVAAQGAPLVYLIIVLVYAGVMNWLDKRYKVDERPGVELQ
jgi:putative solute:sodium symporter small subunit